MEHVGCKGRVVSSNDCLWTFPCAGCSQEHSTCYCLNKCNYCSNMCIRDIEDCNNVQHRHGHLHAVRSPFLFSFKCGAKIQMLKVQVWAKWMVLFEISSFTNLGPWSPTSLQYVDQTDEQSKMKSNLWFLFSFLFALFTVVLPPFLGFSFQFCFFHICGWAFLLLPDFWHKPSMLVDVLHWSMHTVGNSWSQMVSEIVRDCHCCSYLVIALFLFGVSPLTPAVCCYFLLLLVWKFH
jgi:hypothetical protein